MSLQVWLPLTKDTRQQGLSGISVTGSPASWGTGKLGKCATWSGSAANVVYNNTTDFNYTDNFSVAFWINPVFTSGSTQYAWTVGRADAGGYGYGLNINNATTGIFRFGTGSYSVNMPSNEWHHYVMTVGNSKVTIYKDGIQSSQSALPGTLPTYSDGNGMGLGCFHYSGNIYPFYGSMNDFRIYDHCLSPMEIKELAKGLVLHYPLNRQGWGQENLMPNSIEMPEGSANPSTGTWRLAGSSQMTRSRVAISDAPSGASTYGFQSIGLQTGQDASCWGIDNFPRENGITYTLSAWGRIVGGSSTAAMLGFSVYSGTTLDYGGTYGKATSSDAKYYGSGAYDYAGGQLNPNGSWTRVYRTFTSTSTFDNIYIGFNTAKTGNNVTLQLCGVKLEKGDKMTPWTPNSNESMYTTLGLNSTTEYDCSGFCNNGTRTGTFTWTSDTPKYNISTYMPKAALITHPRPVFGGTDQEWTCAMWVKLDDLSSSQMLNNFNRGNYLTTGTNALLYLNDGTNDYYNYANTKLTAGVWTHVVFVFKNTNVIKRIYFNGVDKTNTSGPNKTSTPAGIPDTVTVGTNLAGYISDYRIYATALSADDVKSLYQNSAYIDSSGNVYGAVHMEV